MKLTDNEVKEILDQNSKRIEGIEKMALNLYAIHNIRYWYSHLLNFPVSQNLLQDMMQIEAYTTSISVAYGRLFGEGQGKVTKLERNILPEEYLHIHDEIINLRHGRYAHHGNDPSIRKSVPVKYDGKFKIGLEMEIGFYIGAPKAWQPLFEWLDDYMYRTLYKKIHSLSKKTRQEWEMENGPVPKWIEP